MSSTLENAGRHLLASRTLLGRRPVQSALMVAAVVTLLSIMLAPNASPSTWDWIRIVLAGTLGAVAVLLFALAQAANARDTDRQQRLIIAAVLMAIAIILNLTFTVGATLVFSIGITVIALLAGSDRSLRSSWLIAAILIAVIPFWIWSALEAWTWGLTLLVPLAAIGAISDGHMRAATGLSPDAGSPLTRRAHRLAGWAGVFGSALLALAVGLVTNSADGVVALGAIGAMVFVALEAGTPNASASSPRTSVAMIDMALAWIALCWIVSL